jgi:coenzyme F420-reducing hydrogenase beta subunit/polysaccharide pyruvyl transferase WcaK-like protein
MRFNPYGEYRPFPSQECTRCGLCTRVCPFQSGNLSEDQLAESAFASVPGIRLSSVTGYYLTCHAGHVQSHEDRLQRSSGGLTTWLLKSLLERSIVTRAAQVVAAVGDDRLSNVEFREVGVLLRRPLFEYSSTGDAAAIGRAAKSAYYPVEISSVIREIINTPGRYAIVGLPCFLKAIRLAMQDSMRLRERVSVLIGLACGGTRSVLYADYLCALSGGEPFLMKGADFRVKDPQRPTWDYGFRPDLEAQEAKCGSSGSRSSSFALHSSDCKSEAWTRRYFEPEACSYCDDVLAEAADVVFMDAWLSRYMAEPGGTNLVLVRRPDIVEILAAGARSGEILLEDVTIHDVVHSQQATIDLRRMALAERLGLARLMGWAAPTKRVAPARASPFRLAQLLLERAVRHTSRSAFRPQDALDGFGRRMRLPVLTLKALNYLKAATGRFSRRPASVIRQSIVPKPPIQSYFSHGPGIQHPSPDSRNYFALTGNGPVTNRGCEAIVLGTKYILEQEFGAIDIWLASFANDRPDDLPNNVHPIALAHERSRWSKAWWQYQVNRLAGRRENKAGFLDPLRGGLPDVKAALSVGGDGYSIDFGHFIVDRLVIMDDYLKSRGIPVIVWGASVGPFEREPEFEKAMVAHFAELDLIVVREPRSFNYLRKLGLGANLRLAPDPAFALPAASIELPDAITSILEDGCLGLNFSPLLARYVTGGDISQWRECAAACAEELLRETGLPILLIPHVTMASSTPAMDDAIFLRSVLELLNSRQRLSGSERRVALLPPGLNSQQLKWVISKTRAFIGARAHATMAALSSGVPCLSLAYSRKAWGINELVFGHTDWVLSPVNLTPGNLSARTRELITRQHDVRSELAATLPELSSAALSVAHDLRHLLGLPVASVVSDPSPDPSDSVLFQTRPRRMTPGTQHMATWA